MTAAINLTAALQIVTNILNNCLPATTLRPVGQ